MSEMKAINLRTFKKKAALTKGKFRRFLSKIDRDPPRHLNTMVKELEAAVWKETDCLSCANCCKTMTPTFNSADLKRISAHFGQTIEQFQKQWLYKERGGDRDWMNKTQPCQFLNLKDNKCSIYEIRPADCSGFPHLAKNLKDFIHIHKQNVEYCPATYSMVEKMMARVGEKNL
jgi:Fe-S-cluster containining protein